ncbi:DUF4145 domain-containing protein [Enterobacter sp. 170198]|uniref:DUF4145 domain-containing protein n=1 Tax=Enterobacter chinensis TaxID=3030997 RepID=A0ABU5D4I7_9ENTR|nr:DUF4145 domain-containing protein [Enterobacter sp. 170198]MDY0418893.1 DUF4145 domain-containing protein [Enterobacter sp. 170198]
MQYYPPVFNEEKFHCPLCNVYAKQVFKVLEISWYRNNEATPVSISRCDHCSKDAYWFNDRLLVPSAGNVENPNPDMPNECKSDYEEAKSILNLSPKGATAILRLCLQKLMINFGLRGENINDDIAILVQKGLPQQIQQALDICRVVGNNAVHPGEINIDDSPEIAASLFGLINLIVDDQVSRPKRIAEMYANLPIGAIRAITKRDSK